MVQIATKIKDFVLWVHQQSILRMKVFFSQNTNAILSKKRTSTIVLFYLLALFVVLVSISWDMGLHADDYWITYEAHTRGVLEHFVHFLNNINSRYTTVAINTFFVKLFYKEGDPFDFLFIRVVKISGFIAHLSACWLVYKCFEEARIPRIGILIALPLMTLPTWGWEAFLWNSAILGYSFGFLFFMVAVYSAFRGWSVLFAVGTFLACGATEYIMVPSFILGIFLVYQKWVATREKNSKRRVVKTVVGLLLVLLPFALWVGISLETNGALSRSATINGNKALLIIEEPWQWVILYFKRYCIGMQPYEWVREYWYVIPSIIAAGAIAAPGWRNRTIVLVAASFYFGSIGPMAAVGYNFLNTPLDGIILRSSRLFYFPGIFFVVSVSIAVAFVMVRMHMLFKKFAAIRLVRSWAIALTVLYIGSATGYHLHNVKVLAKGSEDAFGCLRGFVETVFEDTKGVPPKLVSVCGLPWIAGHSPIFRGPFSGPHALALRYNVSHKIPLRRHARCPSTMKLNFDHPECKYRAAYNFIK